MLGAFHITHSVRYADANSTLRLNFVLDNLEKYLIRQEE